MPAGLAMLPRAAGAPAAAARRYASGGAPQGGGYKRTVLPTDAGPVLDPSKADKMKILRRRVDPSETRPPPPGAGIEVPGVDVQKIMRGEDNSAANNFGLGAPHKIEGATRPGMAPIPEALDRDKVFKKGQLNMDEGGIDGLLLTEEENKLKVAGAEGESIDFAEHQQEVFSTFNGAREMDWVAAYDLLLDRDMYNRKHIMDWEMREPELVRPFVAIRSLIYLMEDVYFVNPSKRHLVPTFVLNASQRLEEKTLKAGWWQESFRKLYLRNQVEESPYLRVLMAAIQDHNIDRFHIRNFVNAYLKLCTVRAPQSTSDMLKSLGQIYGSYFFMLADLLGLKEDPNFDKIVDACTHMGKAYGLITVLRTMEEAKTTKAVMVPEDMLKAGNLDVDMLHRGVRNKDTAELYYRLLDLMADEDTQACKVAPLMHYHHKQLLFFRYRAEIRAFMKQAHKFKYKYPYTDEEKKMWDVYMAHHRVSAVYAKRIRFDSM